MINLENLVPSEVGLRVANLFAQDPESLEGQLPAPASTFAESHDNLFYFVFWICVFFFV